MSGACVYAGVDGSSLTRGTLAARQVDQVERTLLRPAFFDRWVPRLTDADDTDTVGSRALVITFGGRSRAARLGEGHQRGQLLGVRDAVHREVAGDHAPIKGLTDLHALVPGFACVAVTILRRGGRRVVLRLVATGPIGSKAVIHVIACASQG